MSRICPTVPFGSVNSKYQTLYPRHTTIEPTKPITVKFRSGIDENHINAVAFAKMCEEAGASLITIHPRTKVQGYSGSACYDIVKDVVKSVSIPVVASGDVGGVKEYDYLINECGASGVMIGRKALGRPEIFEEILKRKQKKQYMT